MPVIAIDNFGGVAKQTMGAPATRAFAIAKSDTDELSEVTRAIWVGGGGDIVVVLDDMNGTSISIKGVTDGTLLPFRVKQVKSTGTTATDMVGLC